MLKPTRALQKISNQFLWVGKMSLSQCKAIVAFCAQKWRRSHNRHSALTVFSVLFLSVFMIGGPAWSIELDQPSSVVDTGETTLPIISAPSPVQASKDSCLPLLKSARYYDSPSSVTSRNRQSAGKAAAVGLIFGVRFALGPEEVTKSRKRGNRARFDVWQPRDGSGAQALAVAQYRRCKNDQALKAISDWRWAR